MHSRLHVMPLFVLSLALVSLTGCWWDKSEPAEETKVAADPGSSEADTAVAEVAAGEAPRADLYATPQVTGPLVDNAEFDFPYWVDLATSKIARTLRVPRSVNGKHTCKVYFQVDRSGEIVALRVEEPSRSTTFDRACVEAIKFAQPFPPLPAEYQSDKIGLTVPLRSY